MSGYDTRAAQELLGHRSLKTTDRMKPGAKPGVRRVFESSVGSPVPLQRVLLFGSGAREVFGFSGYQPLIRTYIGQGLRQDVERLSQQPGIERIIESLRRHGVAEEVINSAVAELRSQDPRE